MRLQLALILLPALLMIPVAASAQLLAAKNGPIVYGHHHVTASNVEAHKKFWIDGLGGTSIKVAAAPFEVIRFPNVLVYMTPRAPSGGTKGTTVNHVGFQVPNIRAAVDRLKANGFPMVTRAELPATVEVKDDLGILTDQNSFVAFVMGPDDTKVELFENRSMTGSIALHHIHFATPDVDDMKAWYVRVFGAVPGRRGSFEAADLPGVNLTYSPSTDPVLPTRGRALDHIGFEVDNLEAFCKRLESMGIKLDRPYTQAPTLGIAYAFITDPWGTSIELTEGLDLVP